MGILSDVFTALCTVGAPANILACFTGLLLGLLFGTLPGLSVMSAVIIVLPLTYVMLPETSLILLTAVYAAGVYGGSATAILLNIPGAPENAASALDGYPMTKKGLSTKALGVAICSSGIGGVIGTIVIVFLSPVMLNFALSIGDAEFFLIALFGLVIAGGIHSGGLIKGYLSVLMGLVFACIGFSDTGGFGSQARLTFGIDMFNSGFSYIPFCIGGLAFAEVLSRLAPMEETPKFSGQSQSQFPTLAEARQYAPTWIRGSIIGSVIGIIPGTGATVASFISYFSEKKFGRKGNLLGTGEPEGIAAPESANNCAAMTTLIPLLTLGIPGGAVAAIMYSAMQIHGLQPGPLLFENNKALVYTLYISALVANLAIFILGRFETRNVAKLLKVPAFILLPLIAILSMIGTYNLGNAIFNVYMMIFSAGIAILFRKHNYSVVGALLGMILCPIAEGSFVRCLIKYDSPMFIFNSVTSCVLVFLIVAFFLYSLESNLHFLDRFRYRKQSS